MYTRGMFKGKRITVMGLGLLGRGVGDVEFFAREGAELTVTDLKSAKDLKTSLDKLKRFKNISYTLGKHEMKDFENRDFVLKAAGVPLDSPFIAHARAHDVSVYMSTALFVSLTPATIVGITGTRGKTTVTHMLYQILKAAYKGKTQKVYIGGNIQGMATLPLVKKVKKGDVVVLELDSWQLQGFGDMGIAPKIGIFTTFMPDHLNYYKGDLMKYFEDKQNVFRYQKARDVAIAGEQVCLLPKAFTKKFPPKTRFVSENSLPKGLSLKVPGLHNRYNAALAYVAARKLKVKEPVIKKALASFGGVTGRLEKIATWKGIDIYNDTTATTPHALVSALEALAIENKKNIVLIMGGSDKTIDLKVLKEPLEDYVKELFLIPGSGTERLKKEMIIPSTLAIKEEKKFSNVVKRALKASSAGDIVLLSPGFASFGMFKNEYDRGDQFVALVNKFIK